MPSDTPARPQQSFTAKAPKRGLRALASGASVAVAGDFVARLLQLQLSILITRALGPTQYGEYSAILAGLAVLGSLIGFGIDTWLLREGGRSPDALAGNVRAVLLTKFSAAAIIFVALAAIGNVVSVSPAVLVGSAGILADSCINTGFAALRSKQRNAAVAAAQVALPSLLLVVLFVLSTFGLNPVLLLMLQAAASTCVALAVFAHLRSQLQPAPVLADPPKVRAQISRVITGAWAFVLADLLANLYQQSGILMLRAGADAQAVGFLRPALTIITVFFILPTIVFNVSLPIVSGRDLGAHEYRRILRVLGGGALLYGLLAVGVLLLSASTVVTFAYGAAFAPTIELLRIVAVVPLFKALSFVCVLILLSKNMQNLRIILQALTVAINLAIGAWMIPQFGASGGAWTTVITEAILLTFYAAGAWRTLRQRHNAA